LARSWIPATNTGVPHMQSWIWYVGLSLFIGFCWLDQIRLGLIKWDKKFNKRQLIRHFCASALLKRVVQISVAIAYRQRNAVVCATTFTQRNRWMVARTSDRSTAQRDPPISQIRRPRVAIALRWNGHGVYTVVEKSDEESIAVSRSKHGRPCRIASRVTDSYVGRYACWPNRYNAGPSRCLLFSFHAPLGLYRLTQNSPDLSLSLSLSHSE